MIYHIKSHFLPFGCSFKGSSNLLPSFLILCIFFTHSNSPSLHLLPLIFGLPLGLLPGSSNLNILLRTTSVSLRSLYSNYLVLLPGNLFPKNLTSAAHPMDSFNPRHFQKKTSSSSTLLPPVPLPVPQLI